MNVRGRYTDEVIEERPVRPEESGRGGRIAGFLIALLGLILAALSILTLAWIDKPQKVTFGDLHNLTSNGDLPDGAPILDHLSFRYFQFGGWVLLALVAISLAAVAVIIMGRDDVGIRGLTAVLAALAAIVHSIVVAHGFNGGDGTDFEFGAWLGTVGYVIVIIGVMIAGTRVFYRRRVVDDRAYVDDRPVV